MFARQAGLSVSYDGLPLNDYRSRYVYGKQTTASALSVLLARTPYTYEFTGDDTIRIVRRPQPSQEKISPIFKPPYAAGPDTILVTATKRAAYVQKIPASVSAVYGDRMRELGVRDLAGLAPKLAGVARTNLGPSRNKVFLRGISDGSFADRTQSTVGVYLDETPIIFNDTNPDLRLIDVDRIEVVRGPQGISVRRGRYGRRLSHDHQQARRDGIFRAFENSGFHNAGWRRQRRC